MAENKKKIQIWVTPKQYQFFEFINRELKFGEIRVKIHASDPQEIQIEKITKIFDGNMKKPLDKTLGYPIL